MERNFRTLKERWLYGLDFDQIQSLEELNRMLKDYIRQHNTTVHSAIKVSPLERYMKTGDRIRRPQSREWLEESFCNRIYRNVRRDATVTIDKDSYDTPFEFIGQRVEIRYLPDQKPNAYILQNGKRYPLRQTNKVENGRTKRQNGLSIDYSRIAGGGSDVS